MMLLALAGDKLGRKSIAMRRQLYYAEENHMLKSWTLVYQEAIKALVG